MNNKKKGL